MLVFYCPRMLMWAKSSLPLHVAAAPMCPRQMHVGVERGKRGSPTSAEKSAHQPTVTAQAAQPVQISPFILLPTGGGGALYAKDCGGPITLFYSLFRNNLPSLLTTPSIPAPAMSL
jgi:hypothetical protein